MKKIFPKLLTLELVGGLGVLLLTPAIVIAGGLFYIDSTTGFAGFGNTTPQSQVDVSGAIYSRLVTATSSTIDWNAGNVQEITLSSNPTLTFSAGQAGGQYTLILQQDGTGGRTVTWPASVKWAGGVAPTLSTTANATDTATFVYNGTDYLGTFALDYGATSLLNDIVAYYKFDSDNSDDATPNDYNGTDSNMTYGSAYGKINDGANFNGSSSRIVVPSGVYGVFNGTNPWSVNMWVYNAGSASAQQFAFAMYTGSTQAAQYGSVLIGFNGGSPNQLFADRGNGVACGGCVDSQIYGNTDLANDTWYMLTVVYDGSDLSIYVDGSSDATPVSSTFSAVSATTGNIGKYINNVWWDGYIDEVGVWSRALTPTEISELYSAGVGSQYPF